MLLKLLLFCATLTFSTLSLATQCKPFTNIPSQFTPAKNFLHKSIYALHSKFSDKNFNSESAARKRAELFDSIFATQHWTSISNNSKAEMVLWNWIRKQYWGVLNIQGLITEEQGFTLTKDNDLKESFSKVYNLPIYPYINGLQTYSCRQRDRRFYPCQNKIYKFKVTLSPSLACSQTRLRTALSFDYLAIKTGSGWNLLDVQFNGLSLIKHTFINYEDFRNKYGTSKAIQHIQTLYSESKYYPINTNQSGSFSFNRKYKTKVPKYPLNF